MLRSEQLKGILPAIPTPVNADDTIHSDAARTLLRYLLKQGIDGVVPLGGTGEYGALSRAERVRMAEITVQEVKAHGRDVPVIAGVLDPGYHDAIGAGRDFAAAGADGLLVLTPYYTNPTQAGIRDYFLRYADESPLPILIYEIPYRTRIAIAPEVLHELSRHENIVGMKACNTDMWHFLRTVAGVDESFAVLSGEDTLFPLHVAAGGIVAALVSLAAVGIASAVTFFTTLGPIFMAMGLPMELLPLLLAVETLPDLSRTIGNVAADVGVTALMDRWTGREAPGKS